MCIEAVMFYISVIFLDSVQFLYYLVKYFISFFD